MYIVQKNHLRAHVDGYETFRWLSHKCKNLYNTALYTIRHHYDNYSKYLSEKELFHQIKSHITYTQLYPDNAQLTLRTLSQNFSAYFTLLSMKKAGKYSEKVHIPHYLPKDRYFVVQFIKRQLKRDEN